MRRVHLLVCLAILLSGGACEKKQTGPIVTRYSDIYKVNDQWYCPLCNQPVKNGDRSHIDPALYLSEWHDEFLDPDYFETKVNHISDDELLRSLHFEPSLQERIGSLCDEEQYDNALALVRDYYVNREDNGRLYHYDQATKIPFITIEEFRDVVGSDSKRQKAIMLAGRHIAHPDSGYTIGEVNFGPEVDYNHDWQDRSGFGVHYCRFFVDVLNAYLTSKDEFYAESFEELFNQWYDQKDLVEHKMKPGETKHRDVIWYELGLGNRIPRIVDSYRVHRERLSVETHKKTLKTVLGSARWLHECLTRTPFHPYNWQTQTAMTLAYVAFLFPEFDESTQWLEASRKNIELHITKDILDDGGYIERTGSYTDYVFGMFYRYMLMFKYFANDTHLIDAYLPRLEKLAEFTALSMSPLGVNCPFNDCRRGTFLAELLVEMGEFFQRGDFLGAIPNQLTPEVQGRLKTSLSTPEATSIDFVDSKFVVMRDGWRQDSYFMMINYGPLQNHGHYDIFDFEIFANGVPIAVDAGLGLTGYSDPIHVSWYKLSPAHNMLIIDDAIVNKRGIEGENVIWAPQAFTDYFAATHRGYEEFHDTVCRRHFAFIKGGYWLILDEVFTPHRGKELDWNFHTPLHMKEIDNGFVSAGVPGAAVVFAASDAGKITKTKRLGRADLRGIEGEEPNRDVDWLIFRKRSEAVPTRDIIAVLVYPIPSDKPHIAATAGQDGGLRFDQLPVEQSGVYVFKVNYEDCEDVVIFSDGQLHSFSENLTGDFVFGWFHTRDGRPMKCSAAEASIVRWGGVVDIKQTDKTNLERKF